MFDALVRELSDRYGLGDRSRDLFGLLMGYIYNDRRGGFGGFAEGFRQQGYGDLFASWLGGDTRVRRTLSVTEVGMVFGQGLLSDWGNRIGASRATVAAAIAGILPRLIGELTPGGRLPEAFGGFAIARSAPDADAGDSDAGDAMPFDDRIGGQIRDDNGLRRRDARIEPVVKPLDAHAAAIAAATAGPVQPSPAFGDPLQDIEFRRPPQERKRGGWSWVLWLLVVAALAVGGTYYWRQFQPLDGVQLPWSAEPDTQ